MSVFEYVNILISILFSIVFAHMLQSIAELVKAGDRVRFSWLHATWMSSVFVCVLANWISVWALRDLPRWTNGYLLFLTVAIFIQYIAAALISPSVAAEGPVDLNVFHRIQGPRYLAAFGLLNGISIPLNVVTAHLFGVTGWGWQNLAQGPAALLTFGAIFVRSPRWQWLPAVAVLALSCFYLFGLVDPIG